MLCPRCKSVSRKRGFYIRSSDKRHIQRFYCRKCRKSFSTQTHNFNYRLRKRRINQICFRLLCSGVSQRRLALILGVKPAAIARRVQLFGRVCERNLATYRYQRPPVSSFLIDELETFEHTKCKPVTVPIAVEKETRKILSLEVGSIAAKGRLSEISKKKYGYRKCERSKVLDKVFSELKLCSTTQPQIWSDQSYQYPPKIKRYFGKTQHHTSKGRRGCIVGQGELKRGGFDPLFDLNHTYAMFRDNLKMLSRRTWCTTKKVNGLRHLLFIYAWFHNLYLDDPQKIILRIQ